MTHTRSSPGTEHANWVLHRQPADQIADHKFSIWSGEHPVVLANEVPGEEGALAYIVSALNGVAQAQSIDPDAMNDKRCSEDMTLAHNARVAAIEECARKLEKSYPDHAWLNAACAAIRTLSVVTSTDRANPASHTHACRTCCGDGYINVHANLPDVKCEDCNGTGRGPEDDPDCRSQMLSSKDRGQS